MVNVVPKVSPSSSSVLWLVYCRSLHTPTWLKKERTKVPTATMGKMFSDRVVLLLERGGMMGKETSCEK